ncbi:MAG: putative amidohydrolase [Planctomycetota bacterium]
MKTISLLSAAFLLLMASCNSSANDFEFDQEVDSRGVSTSVRVAACQTYVSGDFEEGLAAVDRALGLAAEAGAEIACLPETCLFGWVNPEAHGQADSIPGRTTEILGEMARRHGLMIAVGLCETDGQQLFDSAVLIDRNGKLLMRHRKVNILTELMDPPYTPGPNAMGSVVDTRFGRIGMLVCADTFKDELVADIAAGQPDLVLVPYGWAAPAEQWPDHGRSLHSWVAHTARRAGAPVVGVDGTGSIGHGPWTGHVYGGQSVACDADGNVLGVLLDREPDVRVFEIELVDRRD